MRRLDWLALAMVGIAGAGAEAVALDAGAPIGPSVLDLVAGWSLLLAAALGLLLQPWCRRTVVIAAGLWFAGTPADTGGVLGRVASHGAAFYLAPLTVALLAAPRIWPTGRLDRALVVWIGLRAAIPGLAALDLLTVSTGGGLVAVGLRSRDPVVAMPVVPRRASVVLGAALTLAGVLRLAGNDSAWLAPLVSGAVIVCASALIVTGRQVGLPDERMTSLVVDLGRLRDAQSFERRLGGAVGDPDFRLYYRLRSSGSWLDASGTRTAPITDAGQGLELVEGPSGAAAAIVYAEDALREPRLRSAVLGAVAIALERLRLAAEAAEQAEDISMSRRRLVAAEADERRRFVADARIGPDALLGQAALNLEGAIELASDELRPFVVSASEDLSGARKELEQIVAGAAETLVGSRGLAVALAELAEAVGASSKLELADRSIRSPLAITAWYCASEGLANALKHGGARIELLARVDDEHLVVEVRDDGAGGADLAGTGLTGLDARVHKVGGSLHISSTQETGTTLKVELPLV